MNSQQDKSSGLEKIKMGISGIFSFAIIAVILWLIGHFILPMISDVTSDKPDTSRCDQLSQEASKTGSPEIQELAADCYDSLYVNN